MTYAISPKFKAFIKRRAVLRIIDEASGRERETTGEYNPAAGWARHGNKAWEVEKDDVILAFPNVPIITLSASKARSINVKGKTSIAQYSPDTLESALVAMYATARSRVTTAIETLSLFIKANTAISVIILILVIFVFLQFDPIIKNQAADHATLENIKQLLNETVIGKGKII
jgi:hypothetical protein